MAAFDNYIVTFGDRNGDNTITSDVLGFSTVIEAGIGQFGKMTANLTIDNNTGNYTPQEGGGNGTYKTVDWYSQRLEIKAVTGTGTVTPRTTIVFSGVIRGIDITDNGINSTVNIAAVDWLQTATGTPADITESTSAVNVDTAINRALEGVSGYGNGVTLQNFGDATATINPAVFNISSSVSQIARPAQTNVEALDIVSQTQLPAGPFVNYPGEIEFNTSPKTTDFNYYLLNRTLEKDVFFRGNVKFSENPTAPTVTTAELPATSLRVDFTTDNLTTVTSATSGLAGSTTQTVTATAAAEKYGSRSRVYNKTANLSDADALGVANFWTNRQSTIRYTPAQVTTTVSAIVAACGINSNLALSYLFSAKLLPFSLCEVEYTPTGGTQISQATVVRRRTIRATPADTTITLDLLPAVDYQSFTLDSTVLGVLDENRLG